MGCENPRLSTSLLLAILLCCSLAGFSQVTLTASSGTGSGSFTTLKEAFDSINVGKHQGAIVININASTTETATAALNASGTGSPASSYTSISIYPTTTGLSISGKLAAPLIDLNGADNVTIDGRVSASGSTKSLTISNDTTSSTAGTSTIRFINDASSNTLKYCTLKGSSTDAAAGIVFFSTTTGTTGNDNNTIDNNNITNANANRPINAVYALGTVGNNNESNTISNNNVYNFLRTGTASNGINIRSNNSAFTISGNSFYETASFAATASVAYNVILISAASGEGNGFTVSGNYIGGRLAQCGGSAWTKTGFNNAFNAISVTTATGTANEIQGNTIRSIKWTNTGNANFTGISLSGVTVANIGTTTGNIVGSIYDTANAANANFYGINISTSGEVDCRNNTISSIITAATHYNHNNNFYGIFKSSSDGTTTISGNTIGSTTTSNSIIATSLSSSNPQLVYGILSSGTGTVTISGNTVANLNNDTRNRGTAVSGLVNGISVSAGTNTISDNTVRNLTIDNANSSITHTASVSGIVMTSTTAAAQTVSGNTVSNLSNSYNDTQFTGGVIGIYYAGPTTASTVSQNFIHSLSVTGASSIAADICGIKIKSGATIYSNNIIRLGGNTKTDIFGFFETGTLNHNNSLYFNTVYIVGSLASGVTNKSYALYSDVNTNTRDFRNNVLVNARSTVGGSSLHYALFVVSGGTITCDYNNYYVSGTGGVLGLFGSDKTTSVIVTGQDANSIATNPVFFSTGTAASGFAPTVPGTGVTTTGITTDYAGNTRGVPASMGALQVTSWSGGASTDWATTSNWTSGAIPDAGSIVIIPSSLTNYPAVPSDRTLTSLSLASGASLNLSSNTLTLTSNLSNAGSISGDGKLTMGGSSAQTISGTGTVSNLEVNNSAGVTITSGAGNLQSITGVLTPTAGTLTTNGNLTLKSSASGTARVAAVPASGAAISGNVTVERYLPPGRKWRFLTAPLKGSSNNSVYRNWQNNGTPSGATGLDVWGAGGTATPSTGTNGLQIGPSASMRRYGVGGTGGWTDVTDTKSATGATLFDGTTNNAFSVFVKGPFNDGNTAVNEGGAAVATTLSATGTLITGTHTKTLSANPSAGQYFLVGNPYASAVNPTLLSGTNLANTFWMWDATTSGGSGAGSYVAFNRSPGTYNVSTGGFGNSPLTHIQSGQAFFARASAAGTNTTITFEEADKSTATGGGMFGPQQVPDEYGTLRLTLSQTAGSDQPKNLDGAVAFFYANGNPKVDGMDGGKLLNGSENLFFRREGRSLTFEHRATVEAMDTLFVRMGNLQKTHYSLAVEGNGLGKGVECKLLDRLTGKTTSMEVDGTRSYDFTVTDDSLSKGDRFMVLLARLSTQTQTPDGSSVGQGLSLYPNPARTTIRVSMDAGSSGTVLLQVFDAGGVELIRKNLDASGSADVDVSRMPTGLYTLLLTDEKGGKKVGRFVRE